MRPPPEAFVEGCGALSPAAISLTRISWCMRSTPRWRATIRGGAVDGALGAGGKARLLPRSGGKPRSRAFCPGAYLQLSGGDPPGGVRRRVKMDANNRQVFMRFTTPPDAQSARHADQERQQDRSGAGEPTPARLAAWRISARERTGLSFVAMRRGYMRSIYSTAPRRPINCRPTV